MMMPRIFGESLFDDFMNDFGFSSFPSVEKRLYGKHGQNLMKTDVKDKDGCYEIDIDLAGFKKDDIKMELENGYLTVSASKGMDNDKKDEDGNYIRRERYAGSMSRSFYEATRSRKMISILSMRTEFFPSAFRRKRLRKSKTRNVTSP